MATVVSTLYPPVVSTFQNAFVNTEDAVVYFTLSSFNSASEIKSILVNITKGVIFLSYTFKSTF